MIIKLVVCFCICLAVIFGTIAGFCLRQYFTDSEKSGVVAFGALIEGVSIMFMGVAIVGMIIFAIKLFAFYLYGVV